MALQGLMGFAALACVFAGAAGFEHASAIGALVLMGFGIRKFLDTHWTLEPREGRVLRLEEGNSMKTEAGRPKAQRRSSMPVSKWHLSGTNAAPSVVCGYRGTRR
jgi:hypothetical protein